MFSMCMSVVNVFSVSNSVLSSSKLDKNIHDCIVTKLEYPFCFVNSRHFIIRAANKSDFASE